MNEFDAPVLTRKLIENFLVKNESAVNPAALPLRMVRCGVIEMA